MNENRFRFVVVALLALAALLAWGNTLRGEFVWDDVSSILLHRHIQDPTKVLHLFAEHLHAFKGQVEHGGYYRPLLAVSYMVDYALSRPNDPEDLTQLSPLVFHISSILWHFMAAFLLFMLLKRTGAPRFVQAVVPCIFLVHPIHNAAVAYISGRSDPMAAAFMFSAMLFGFNSVKAKKTSHRVWMLIGSTLCFVGALLSREAAAIYPILYGIVAWMVWKHQSESDYVGSEPDNKPVSSVKHRFYYPFVAALLTLVVYGTLRLTVLRFGAASATVSKTLITILTETGQAFALYIRLFFLPTGLHMERTLDDVPAWIAIIGYILLIGCAACIVLCYRKKMWRPAAGMAWFLATWLPISGLYPLNAPMAEHWMYVPMIGFFWCLAELIWSVCSISLHRKQMAYAFVYAFSLFLLALTPLRNRDWVDNETLLRATLEHNPNSMRVHSNLAVTYEYFHNNPAGARRHYRKVLDLAHAWRMKLPGHMQSVLPEEIQAHVGLGNILLAEGVIPDAARHFDAVLSLPEEPRFIRDLADAAFGRAQCYAITGEMDQARKHMEQAISLNPMKYGNAM